MRNSFKKALSLVLALTLLMSMVCISNFAVSAETTQYKLGDVNTDKNINVMDATTIQRIIAKLVVPTDNQRYLANVNGDDVVDIRDATFIQRYIALLINIGIKDNIAQFCRQNAIFAPNIHKRKGQS